MYRHIIFNHNNIFELFDIIITSFTHLIIYLFIICKFNIDNLELDYTS